MKLTINKVRMDGNRARCAVIEGVDVKLGDVVGGDFVLRGIRPELGKTWACEFYYVVEGERIKLFTRVLDDEQAQAWAKEDGEQPEDPYGHDVNARQGIFLDEDED